ncbi:ribosome-associated GTPase EngA [secondary endosymbiont of Heteropsylla cubana]|uniref:GTPase Der n=1 Tax=secondary endosymbiont of Heteropsylla cubana TaxID=134287 RepID=J3TZ96_9ENTR|nr:ribosome biogenesis GTPase Der [secondary endosymbiont of Heteropsylla cubana]AFP85825.1 ribosome-associated GTPase EngA [secondary endosymbiont of Heteropsylla cubana]
MIPTVAIVGRQNVGKSTLFNRLTRTRDALVANFPGLTRDRKYGIVKFEDNQFNIIDTAGINDNCDKLENLINTQSLLAITEADIVLFIVDGRAGLMKDDINIAHHLRQQKKTTLVVVNKTDGMNPEIASGDFYALGIKQIVSISASHGSGITILLNKIFSYWKQYELSKPKINLEDRSYTFLKNTNQTLSLEKKNNIYSLKLPPLKLAIVGRPNVGKSTLINCILGIDRVIVYDMPGTTRDNIYIPVIYNKKAYILIDTAGVRKNSKVKERIEKFSIIKTLKAIQDANVVLLVINARDDISDQDVSLLSFVLNSGRALVIAVNKSDGLSSDTRKKIKEELDRCFSFINFVQIHFISSLYNIGIGNLFNSVNEAYRCANKRISTALLTRIMHTGLNSYQPPLVQGRRVKLKYAHTGGYNPLILVIHGTKVNELPDNYKRYLINHFRRSLNIIGTPIRLQFKETANPFAGKRNILTPRQSRKRKRLINYIKKT